MSEKFAKLLELAATLRGENGCPWDREQTLEAMSGYLKEEVGELQQAIEKNDDPNLAEEIGDVLFQLIMITQIASESGKFEMDQVLDHIINKIITRHTWVFGDDKASTPEEALVLWKANKAKEKL